MIKISTRCAAAIGMLSLAAPLAGQEHPSPGQIIEQAPEEAWRPIASEDLLVGTLASGDRVVIQLAPQFAPKHVANVRALAAIGWWDDTPINRVQDNFVTQWGGVTIKRPPPENVPTNLPREYDLPDAVPIVGIAEVRDAWSATSGFIDGWPVSDRGGKITPAHCYGTLGAGRENPPDTGWGSELYVVIGQPPRQLDGNIAVVGRVIEGMEFLAGVPRGRGPGGELTGEQKPARWKSLARADRLAPGNRPQFEYLSTDSPAFSRYAAARATYRNPFYLTAPGAVDLCSVPVPIRTKGRGRAAPQ